ncbi:hypothetical protein PAXINDRAFT_21794 [Paxillus involutus ATCC 200175]|uniref:Uncharacterized protein n=1 Tax=Paxillus involutus ATCC 200175 TaxID=664439 RepID=A0A0C9TCC0_PAXIN|nr:hypothetical protein PAXINDRAFT_21794 [Paxillus involutus ATCC 200175]
MFTNVMPSCSGTAQTPIVAGVLRADSSTPKASPSAPIGNGHQNAPPSTNLPATNAQDVPEGLKPSPRTIPTPGIIYY